MNDDKREQERAQMALGVKNLRENMPMLLEFDALQARLTRARYLALLEQGFTEPQALELCKK